MRSPRIALTVLLTLLSASAEAQPGPSADARHTLLEVLQETLTFRQPLLTKRPLDYSPEATRLRLDQLASHRERLSELPWRNWPVSDQIEFLLVRAELDRAEFEHRILRPWERDPGLDVDVVRDIAFTELPTAEDQLADFKANLQGIPSSLLAARTRLAGASPELARLALHNLRKSDGVEHGHPYRRTPPHGVLGWYADLVERVRRHHPDLLDAAQLARQAVREFDEWLEQELPNMTAPAGVGETHYLWYIHHVEFQPHSVQDIIAIGERELERTLAALILERARNRNLPPLSPAQSESEYLDRIAKADRHVRDFITSRGFLTIPDYIGNLGDNVPWKIRAAGKRNFWEEIQYRDPLPDKVHAGIPGHRFDLAVHERDQRPIRRNITSANRIEGWGFYLEEAMMTAGLLDDRPRTRELFHIFGAARAVRNKAEVMLHSNRWTVEQAVRYMVDRVPYMDEDVARVDCEIYLRRPGYGQSYLMGKVQIEQLLAERAAQTEGEFDLGRFHDEFLRAGLIPVSLIRWEMTGNPDQIDPLLASYRPLGDR